MIGKTTTSEESIGAKAETPGLIEELRAFKRHVSMLESKKARLVKEHPEQWAALHDGNVIFAGTLEEVLEKVDKDGYPRTETAIQFLDPNPQDMIL